MYTNGDVLLKVCGGASHCRADEFVEVANEIKISDWLERESVRREPLMGSASEERENGTGERVWASTTEEMERERVSMKRGPV